MAETNIEWTNKVWNPVRGCSRVSEGCRNCYAERQAIRQAKPGQPYHGLVMSHEILREGEKRREPRWTGKIALDEKALLKPLSWREPQKVFVNSMSDLFHKDVPDEFIDKIFAVMALTPQHTYQILTKRPERMLAYFQMIDEEKDKQRWCNAACEVTDSPCAAGTVEDTDYPLPNVWLGTSVENQETADERIPLLLQTPAAVRWISAEPLLGPIDLGELPSASGIGKFLDALNNGSIDPGADIPSKLDWVVVGGESGPGARSCNIDWISSIVSQCQAAEVAVFVKQLGSYAILDPRYDRSISGASRKLADRKGGNIEEFPADLQVREYPEVKLGA